MFIVLGILTGLGTVITCGLGILVAIPYIYCVIFAAYDDIIQPQTADLSQQIDDFGQAQKDTNTESEDDR